MQPVGFFLDRTGPAWIINNFSHLIWVISSTESLYLLLKTCFMITEQLQNMVINAYGRTWKVADPILLDRSINYRKIFSCRSCSRVTETLMSKTTRYFFWYILRRQVWAGFRRKILANARNLEARIQWRILWLDFFSAHNCQELGRAGSRVRSTDPCFRVPSNFRWVLTENSFFPTELFPSKIHGMPQFAAVLGKSLGALYHMGWNK